MERSDIANISFEQLMCLQGFVNAFGSISWDRSTSQLMVACFQEGGFWVYDNEVQSLRSEVEKYKTALREAEARLAIAQKVIAQKNASYRSGKEKCDDGQGVE